MEFSNIVVLVNYNSFGDTKECLKSIFRIKNILPFVILIDNASSESEDLNSLHIFYPNLKIIRNLINVGFGMANNQGVNWAIENLDFEYLLLLNNDTLITKNSIFYLTEAFKIDPKIGITTAKTMYADNPEIVWYGGGDINYKRGWPKISDYNQIATKNGADKARFVSFVSGCVMMFTKESIKKLQGFDDDFFMYCEDLELCMRASNMGYKFYYEPKSIIYHKVQGSLKGKLGSKVTGLKAANRNLEFLFYNMKSNQYLAMKKNLSFLQFQIFKGVFWSEFFLLNLKMIVGGRRDMLSISSKTIKRILELN